FQFETLKNQVNPHFLFNSFNTLITIIEDNPKIAVEYVDRLSQFFRNIVMYREKDVILLKEELELLDNYYFLQKKRFCDNLSLFMDIPDELKISRYVPPLTLQLLMETAVNWFQHHPMPDLILLDIHLADGQSFEIFEQVDITSPVIFITAFDEYAIQAFKVNSIDYLLKPIKKEDLEVAVKKFHTLHAV